MTLETPEVYTSQADIGPKERMLPEMAEWCATNGNVAVLTNGMILAEDPKAIDVQNCMKLMRKHNLIAPRVQLATQELIHLMLSSVEKTDEQYFYSYSTDEITASQELLYAMIKDAMDNEASDIHLEVREHACYVRFRRDGVMYLYRELTSSLGRSLAAVAFNAETDQSAVYFNPNESQSASMQLDIAGRPVRLRISSVPELEGFDVVMRLLTVGDKKKHTLKELGYPKEHVYLLEKILSLPNGAMIIAGATGSGKTTTLAACLDMMPKDKKIYTAEDPVEKRVKNASQIPVKTDRENQGFAGTTRALMRMDPDIIMIGETRDADTANVLASASITGHLVFTTLHANSATNIIPRLKELGLSPLMLSDPNFIVCLAFQRLLPTLCPDCSVSIEKSDSYQANRAEWKDYFAEDYAKIKVKGDDPECKTCEGRGITGRHVVAEMIWLDKAGRQYIKDLDIMGWEKYLKEQGWRSVKDYAYDEVIAGKCDPHDAEGAVGKFNSLLSQDNLDYENLTDRHPPA